MRPLLMRTLAQGASRAIRPGCRGKTPFSLLGGAWPSSACLRVEATQTPNPDALKLLVLEDRPLLPKHMSSVSISRKRRSRASSLPPAMAGIVDSILAVDNIEGVFVGDGFLTVTKASEADWDDITGHLLQLLDRAFLPTAVDEEDGVDQPAQQREQEAAGGSSSESDVEMEIKELLDEKVRPYLQADGGEVEFVRFDRERGVVHLAMLGACASCSSSTVTLKFMVRNLLCHYFAGTVQDVESVDLEHQDDCLLAEPHHPDDGSKAKQQDHGQRP